MGRISRSRESVGKFVKSSPLERPKNRYRSFSFWNLSFNDGSRLWRQAPGVTEGQKGANKFSKVCIVPYIYIYLDCFKLCNRKNISKSSWCVLFRLFAARVSRVSEIYTQPEPPFSFYLQLPINWAEESAKLVEILFEAIFNCYFFDYKFFCEFKDRENLFFPWKIKWNESL